MRQPNLAVPRTASVLALFAWVVDITLRVGCRYWSSHWSPQGPAAQATSCPDDLGMCRDVSCIDYAATIGGCGDALPYASAYPCMVEMCEEACSPGAGFTACSSV